MITKCKYKYYTKRINTYYAALSNTSAPGYRFLYVNIGSFDEQIPKLKDRFNSKEIKELARELFDAMDSTEDIVD